MRMRKKFGFVGVLAGLAFSSLSFASLSSGVTSKNTLGADIVKRAYSGDDFSSETALTDEELNCSVVSSTTTGSSHALSVSFSSDFTCYNTGTRFNGDVVVMVDDDSYSGNEDDYPSQSLEKDRPVFEASVYKIKTLYTTNNNGGSIVIPRYLNVSTKFRLHIVSIGADLIDDAEISNIGSNTHLESVCIPSDVTTIESGAFSKLPSYIPVKCEAASLPSGYADGWVANTTTVSYGEDLSSVSTRRISPTAGNEKVATGKNYILGYFGEGQYNKPLIIEYKKKKADGSEETIFQECKLDASINKYEGVGSEIGTTTLTKNIDLELKTGESLEMSSLKFHNIFDAGRDSNGNFIIQDINKPYYKIPAGLSTTTYDLNEFITVKTSRASYFSGYTQFDISVDRVPGIYEKVKADMYETLKDGIKDGTYRIRYQFNALSSASYKVTFMKDGVETTKTVSVKTPAKQDYILLEKDSNNEIGFIFENSQYDEDFNYANITSIALEGFSVKLDVYSDTNNSIVTKSNISKRFGTLYLYQKNSTNFVNINTMYILSVIIYTVAFAAAAVIYYFYSKNKFKNDEFRRMNTKRYVVSSLKNYFGFALVLLGIISIIARWGVMDTSIVAFNPIDVYVTVFVIAGGIFLGFFIKGIVVSVKNAMKRKEAMKLKLDQDKADDGTN